MRFSFFNPLFDKFGLVYISPIYQSLYQRIWFNFFFFFFSSQRELHSVGNIDFLVGVPTSICHFFRVSVRRAPYLRNCTWSNRSFRYTCVKSYLQGILLFDSYFEIFIFGDVRGLKGQKIDQNEKSVAHHIQGTV